MNNLTQTQTILIVYEPSNKVLLSVLDNKIPELDGQLRVSLVL